MKKKCPMCGSVNLGTKEYAGAEFTICFDCDYDESQEMDIVPEEKKSQKAKGEFSPYKSRVGK